MVIHIFLWIKPVEMWINLKIQKFMRRLSTNLDKMEVHIIDEEILRCTRGAKDGDISHMG